MPLFPDLPDIIPTPTAFVDSPLSVTTLLKFKHLICEGPIEGLVRDSLGEAVPCSRWVGSPLIECGDTTNVSVGDRVVGPGIPVGAYVVALDPNLSFTLNVSCTTETSGVVYVGGAGELQSVFFNKTPLQNPDGSFNFKGWTLLGTNGDRDQAAIEGFDGTESSVPGISASEIKYGETSHVATITNLDANAARLILAFPALTRTDTKTGETHGSAVTVAIDLKASGDAQYTEIAREYIAGKSPGQYVRAVRINLGGTGPWQVRVRRIEPDATDTYTQNKVFWQGMFEITDLKLTYPYSVVFAGQFDASQLEGIPDITYHLNLLRVQVPANYDPVTRTYATSGPGTTSGVWDGTFKTAWTDNPAWCFYDILTKNRYGLGEYIDAAVVDKWTLYDIAQYCDVLVPDGQGGMEPRLACNLFLQSREEAFRVVANFASIFRGIAWWATGKILFYQDRLRSPVFTFTQANVENGMFSYSGTAKKARHSVALVAWNDPNDFSEKKIEYVEDSESIRLFGIRELNLTAFGCTSRGQARRLGLWALYSEREETETVTFFAGFDALQNGVTPGSIINVADPARAGKRVGGRVVSVLSSTSIRLDQAFAFEVSKSYTLYAIDPNGDLITKAIVNPGVAAADITLTTPLTGGLEPAVNSVWAIGANDLALQQFRILAIEETKSTLFKVTALEYDSGKYALIEQGVDFDETPVTSLPPTNRVDQPVGLALQDDFSVVPEGIERRIQVSWTHVTTTYAKEYEVEYRYAGLGWQDGGKTTANSVFFRVRFPGDYDVRVRAINIYGRKSPWTVAFINLPEALIANASITGLELEGQGNDTEFIGKDPVFVWRYNSPDTFIDVSSESARSPLLEAYVVKIYKTDGTLLRIEDCPIARYTYTHDKNFEDTGGVPVRSFRIQIAARDRTQRLSNAAQIDVRNTAPFIGANPPAVDLTAFRYATQGGKIIFNYTPPNDIDFQGVMIFVKKGSAGFALSEVRSTDGAAPLAAALVPYDRATDTGMLLYKGKDTYIPVDLDPTETYQFIFAPYDLFGLEGINYYGSFLYNIDFRIDTVPPATPTGLLVTTVSDIDGDGNQRVRLVAKWDPNSETDLDAYGLSLREITGTPLFSGVNLTGYSTGQLKTATYSLIAARTESAGFLVGTDGKVSAEFVVRPGKYYELTVNAVDTSSNTSAFVAFTTANVIQSAADTQAPAVPTFASATPAFRFVSLRWNPNTTDDDFNHFELWQNTINNSGTATKVRETAGTAAEIQFPLTGLLTNTTYYYWLKSVDHSGNISAFSTVQSVTLPEVSAPTGLSLSTGIDTDVDATQKVWIEATWTNSATVEVKDYLVEIATSAAGNNFQRQVVSTNKARFYVNGNVLYYVRVRANDSNAGFSAWSSESSLTSTKDATIPAAPTGVTIVSSIKSVFLSWTNPAVSDYLRTNIYRNTINTFPGGTPYARVSGNAFVDSNVVQGTTYYYFFKSEDTSFNETVSPTSSVNTTPGQIQTADIANFAVDLTKQYHATIALSGDVWTNNSPTGTAIAWNSHSLYYGGAVYTIAAGNTTNGYIYWNPAVSTTVYQTSATNPALGDGMFVVATNVAGIHDLAWNAIANALIGSAYIQDLAVTNAKILSLAVDKLTAGTVTSQAIIITGAGGYIQSGNYVAGSAGFKFDAATGILYGMAAVLKGGAVIGTPGSSGLYLGSDKIGFFSGSTWDAYIDSSGNMKLGTKLDWNNGTGVLTITGYISVGGAAADVNANATTIAGGKITASTITATQLSATITTTKELVLDYSGTGGTIRSTGATALNTGSGIWMTKTAGGSEFRVGDPSGNYMRWDGSTLTISGVLDVGTGVERTVINGTTFYRGTSGGNRIELYSNVASTYSAVRAYNSLGNVVGIFGTEITNGYGMIRLHTAAGVEKLFLDGTDGTIVINNQIRGPFNTASNPTYTFSSRTDDGIYSPADGNLGVALNGKLAMSINEFSNSFAVEFGSGRTGDGDCFFDLHASTSVDYSLRLLRSGGVNGGGWLVQRGTGALTLYQEDGYGIVLSTSSTVTASCTTFAVSGTATIGNGLAVTNAITATGDITAFYSDRRLKKDFVPITNALERIKALTGYFFYPDVERLVSLGMEAVPERQVGLIAQDVQAVLGEVVKLAPFDRNAAGTSKSGENYLTIQYERIIPLLVQAVNEQQQQIEALKLQLAKR